MPTPTRWPILHPEAAYARGRNGDFRPVAFDVSQQYADAITLALVSRRETPQAPITVTLGTADAYRLALALIGTAHRDHPDAPKLPSTINSQRIERQIATAARAAGYRRFDLVFEHGHWWLLAKANGETFDCVDTAEGFAFESMDDGDGESPQ